MLHIDNLYPLLMIYQVRLLFIHVIPTLKMRLFWFLFEVHVQFGSRIK